jgi:hypothetical protein
MGFWRQLFACAANDIDHPVLGRISRNSHSNWLVNEVESIGCRGKPQLFLAGDASGPNPGCLTAYQRLRDDWERVKPRVADQIFDLNQNYFCDEPYRALRSPNEVWDAAELLGIGVDGEGDFSLTYRFDWQHERDGHEITIWFRNWTPAGVSMDG